MLDHFDQLSGQVEDPNRRLAREVGKVDITIKGVPLQSVDTIVRIRHRFDLIQVVAGFGNCRAANAWLASAVLEGSATGK